MYSTLEDSCILCSSQESLTAQSHSTLRSLNLVSICNKYLSEEVIGPFNQEFFSNKKTWLTFCNTCFGDSQTLSNLVEELEAIESKIEVHVKEMKLTINKNRIDTLRVNKLKGECFIIVDNTSPFSNLGEVAMSSGTGTNNIITVEQGFLNTNSEPNYGTSISNNDKQSKSTELPLILKRRSNLRVKPTMTMKPVVQINPAVPRKGVITAKPAIKVKPPVKHSKRVTPDQQDKYSCKKCGESFEKSSQLIMHSVNVHTKEKTFQCDVCPLWFSSSAKVKMHKDADHTVSKYKCTFCDKYFEFYVNLEHHLEKHIEINSEIVNVGLLPQNVDNYKAAQPVLKPKLFRTRERCSTVTSSEVTDSNVSNEQLLGMDVENGEIFEIGLKPEVKMEEWPPTMIVKTEESD